MPKNYHASLLPELHAIAWDAIVVGSGLGGLTTASLLARRGKRVLVLERHSVPGGFTHTFTRKGFEWDVGVHYVGQVNQESSPVRKVFDYISDGNLAWNSMGNVYDQAVIAGRRFDFVNGAKNLQDALIQRFPAEARQIRKYINRIRSVSAAGAWFFGEKTMPPWMSATLGRILRWRFLSWSKKTTQNVLQGMFNDPEIIALLCTQCGDYGLSPAQSSFGIHAVVVAHYLDGASYPVGGASRIPETVIEGFESRGGSVLLKAEVTRLRLVKGRVIGVELQDGSILSAPVVISNIGVQNTFQQLLGDQVVLPKKIAQGLEILQPSTAHLCLYVGLDGNDQELGLPTHNIWIYDQIDFDQTVADARMLQSKTPSMAYISFPSAKDPEWQKHHPNRATVQVITACPYQLVEAWQGRPWMKRGEEYVALKSELQTQLLEKLFAEFPHLRNRIAHCELSTPITTRHFAGYQHGEIYGLAHTPARFAQRWLRPQTPIPGLYLTGQDVITVGVAGALFSGVLTASAVLKRPVLWEVFGGAKKSSKS